MVLFSALWKWAVVALSLWICISKTLSSWVFLAMHQWLEVPSHWNIILCGGSWLLLQKIPCLHQCLLKRGKISGKWKDPITVRECNRSCSQPAVPCCGRMAAGCLLLPACWGALQVWLMHGSVPTGTTLTKQSAPNLRVVLWDSNGLMNTACFFWIVLGGLFSELLLQVAFCSLNPVSVLPSEDHRHSEIVL